MTTVPASGGGGALRSPPPPLPWYLYCMHYNLEIRAHVWNDLGYLICLRHSLRSRTVTNVIFTKLPSDRSTMSITSIQGQTFPSNCRRGNRQTDK